MVAPPAPSPASDPWPCIRQRLRIQIIIFKVASVFFRGDLLHEYISPIRKSRVFLDGKRGFQVGCCVSDFVWLDCLARLFQRCGHLEV